MIFFCYLLFPFHFFYNYWLRTTKKQALSNDNACFPLSYYRFTPFITSFPKPPWGQSLCRKSTSGWRFLPTVLIVADAVWLRWTGQEMSRAACGRCNRYCPMNDCLLHIFNQQKSKSIPLARTLLLLPIFSALQFIFAFIFLQKTLGFIFQSAYTIW